MGVKNPKSDTVPTGVCNSCDVVLLGVGVTVAMTCFVLFPPKDPRKLAMNALRSEGET
jgi:hypothetical protein